MSVLPLVDYLRLVKFSHSVFALPFALSSAWLAGRQAPDASALALIVLCCVAARTAAMPHAAQSSSSRTTAASGTAAGAALARGLRDRLRAPAAGRKHPSRAEFM